MITQGRFAHVAAAPVCVAPAATPCANPATLSGTRLLWAARLPSVERIHLSCSVATTPHCVWCRLRSAAPIVMFAMYSVRRRSRHNVVKQLAEIVGVHVGGSEDCPPCSRPWRSVVVLRGHVLRRMLPKEENRHGARIKTGALLC